MRELLELLVEGKQKDERLIFEGRINQGDVDGEIKLKRYFHNSKNIQNISFTFRIDRPSITTTSTRDKYNQEDLEFLIEVIEKFNKVQFVEVVDGVSSYAESRYSNIKDVKELLEEALEQY